MKRKYLVFTVAVIVILTGSAVFARHSETVGRLLGMPSFAGLGVPPTATEKHQTDIVESQKKGITSPATESVNKSNSTISDEIVFDMFFSKVVSLERTVAKTEARGKSSGLWRNYLQNHGFSDAEISVIRKTAGDYMTKLAPVRERAANIIKSQRAAHTADQTLPPPPPELKELQARREALAVSEKNNLQNRLGTETLEKIRTLMQKNSNNVLLNPADLINNAERIRALKTLKEKRNKVLTGAEESTND